MRFIKGVLLGSLVSASIVLLYGDEMGITKKNMMKKGKYLAKKIGVF